MEILYRLKAAFYTLRGYVPVPRGVRCFIPIPKEARRVKVHMVLGKVAVSIIHESNLEKAKAGVEHDNVTFPEGDGELSVTFEARSLVTNAEVIGGSWLLLVRNHNYRQPVYVRVHGFGG